MLIGGRAGCGVSKVSGAGGGGSSPEDGGTSLDSGAMEVSAAVDDAVSDAGVAIRVSWGAINRQAAGWYATAEAAAVGDNILYYQNSDGGWPKNIDMTTRTAPHDRSTIDNSATTTEITFLSLLHGATTAASYLEAFNRGVDYLLAAQYPGNGGWPQFYPVVGTAYQRHITYNDNAMIHVMRLLRDVGDPALPPQFAFVDEARAAKAAAAVALGIDCILATQVVVDGVKTGWCAQYDEVTLRPANARAYELISNSGSEGAGVLEFLMSIENPSAEIVEAVEAATAWFAKTQIRGIRVKDIVDVTQPTGRDVVVVADASAPPIWARFYEIADDVPFFCGRDGIKKATLAEIENERRTGYAWYGNWPASVLADYAATWQPRWAPDRNVLATAAGVDASASAADDAGAAE